MVGELVVCLIVVLGLMCFADWVDNEVAVEGIWRALLSPMFSIALLMGFCAAVAWAAVQAAQR